MIPPEVIDRIRHEKEERERVSSQIPLYIPELTSNCDECEEKEDKSRVIIIDLI